MVAPARAAGTGLTLKVPSAKPTTTSTGADGAAAPRAGRANPRRSSTARTGAKRRRDIKALSASLRRS